MSHRRSRRSLHRDPRGRDRPRLVVSPGTRRVPLPGARSRPDPAPRRPAPRGRALHTGPEGRALRDRRYAPMSHRRSRRSLYRDRRRRQRPRLVVSPGTRRVPLPGARSRPIPPRDARPPRGRALHTGPEGLRVARPAIRGDVTSPTASIAVQGSATSPTPTPRRIAGHATRAPPRGSIATDPAPRRPAPRGRALHTGPEGRALRDRRYAAMSHRRSRRSLYRDPRGRDRPRLVVSPGTRRVPLPGARSRPICWSARASSRASDRSGPYARIGGR
jgi:hypothetical protein